jgi:GNAT superfamily N-acetyltransferase
MIFRTATRKDVPALVALLADDPLGKGREIASMQVYLEAFDRIAALPMHQIIVAERGGQIVATCQLTILHGLSRAGMTRALVEAVRTVEDQRGQGIGAALMAEVEARARAAGARMVYLTTDKSRSRAHAFDDRLGYEQTHVGYKKLLD